MTKNGVKWAWKRKIEVMIYAGNTGFFFMKERRGNNVNIRWSVKKKKGEFAGERERGEKKKFI